MGISKGYTKYTDDRDPSIVEMIADADSEAKKNWHEVSRIDANQVKRDYLFGQASWESFEELMTKQDAEFRAWMAGGAE